MQSTLVIACFFFFQAEDGIRDWSVTGVQTCALPIFSNPYDPRENVHAGAQYLKFLIDRFGQDVRLALAAYNAGEGAVDRNGGQIPPFTETMAYVPRVLKIYRMLRELPRST